jgi:hypothetical protein
LVAALHALVMAYGERVTLLGPGSLPTGSLAQVLGGLLWPMNYLLFGLVLLLFPDGRLPSPRWRPVARLIVGSWCLVITVAVLTPSPDNPLGLQVLQPALNLLTNVVNIAAIVGLAVLVAAPFVRFRRAGYQQRQQLKWVAFIALLSMLSAFAGIGLSRLLPAAGLLGALGVLGIAVGIPVAVATAILRHRLYDIDRLINRTIVYGLLTAVLGLSYAAVVLGPWGTIRRGRRQAAELGGGWRHPGHGRPVPAGPPPHPGSRGSALQPPQVRCDQDRGGVHRPAAGRGRPGHIVG